MWKTGQMELKHPLFGRGVMWVTVGMCQKPARFVLLVDIAFLEIVECFRATDHNTKTVIPRNSAFTCFPSCAICKTRCFLGIAVLSLYCTCSKQHLFRGKPHLKRLLRRDSIPSSKPSHFGYGLSVPSQETWEGHTQPWGALLLPLPPNVLVSTVVTHVVVRNGCGSKLSHQGTGCSPSFQRSILGTYF